MTFPTQLKEICERLDKLEEHAAYNTKLLESIVESIPPAGSRPNVWAAMEPLMNSPMIKNNPALAEMVAAFKNNMGGSK
jgi:hypothetical protein